MARPDKEAAVAELKERIENSQIAVVSKYIGMNAEQANDLRKLLRAENVEYKVYKNTLARRALMDLGLEDVAEFMDGPTAWAFSPDPVAAPKLLKNFAKDVPVVEMSGGILDGKVVTTDMLKSLADLPSREVLLAQLVGTMAAPLRNFVGVMSAVPRNLVGVLNAVQKQKEEAA